MLWKIAVAGNESPVCYAAEELCRCLKAMDDAAEVAVMRYPEYRNTLNSLLWLRVCPEMAASVKNPGLDDGYSIDICGGKGCICGTNSRSVLMGVYRFLRELGCTWVRPGFDGEYLPQRSTANAEVHVKEFASYRHRGICIEGAVSYEHVRDTIEWMPKMGYNSYFNQFSNPVCFYKRWYEHESNPNFDSGKLTSEEVQGLRDSSVYEMKRRGLLYHAAGHGWTCEPFGIAGESWEVSNEIPKSARKYLAKVNGKRELWGGIALNTNLCYSNPIVRKKMAEAVATRCREIPETDFMHVWLADGSNNHCECENCRTMIPSDWYVTLLNEIDAQLTKQNLKTKIVFLVYNDLLWEPKQVQLLNPDRFVLMFAPITRTYSSSIADDKGYDDGKLAEYTRNALSFPKSVEENIARLRRWQKQFDGDGFDFDYHFMWDHFFDPGYYQMARTLFTDMKELHKLGLNGMVSCQNQRVFFPDGLGMVSMATALWNENANFEDTAEKFFRDAFLDDGKTVQEYMRSLSDAFDPPYIRREKPFISKESAERFATIPALVENFLQLAEKRSQDEALPFSVRRSWEYLIYHGKLCIILSRAFRYHAEGKSKEARLMKEDAFAFARQHEAKLHHVFDVCLFQSSINWFPF